MVTMESLLFQNWLMGFWMINGCYRMSLIAMASHLVLKKSMVAMGSQWLLCESLVAMVSYWLP
jgi:hypothetical protein